MMMLPLPIRNVYICSDCTIEAFSKENFKIIMMGVICISFVRHLLLCIHISYLTIH